MSIFKRTKDVLASNVNSLLDRVEDPVKLLNQYMVDLGKEISKAEMQVAKQIATTRRLEKQMKDAQKLVDKRDEQARTAVQAGRDDLARRALEEKQQWSDKVDAYLPSYEENQRTSESLKQQLQEMKDKYREMQGKKHELEARASAAKATKAMNQSMSGFGKNNAAKGFERMENRVNEWESQASASMDMNEMREKSLDDEFASLGGSSNVDSELDALKAQMNGGASSEQSTSNDSLTAEQPPSSSVDDELEALKREQRHE